MATHEDLSRWGRLGGIASGRTRRRQGEEARRRMAASLANIPLHLRHHGREKWCTYRQARFCMEFLRSGNIAQAARAAGYSPHSARWHGWQLLHYCPAVRRELRRLCDAAGVESRW